MNYLKTAGAALSVAVALSVSLPTYAQKNERYVNLGTNSARSPILLDIESIEGNEFKIYQRLPGGLTVMTKYEGSCGESRLFQIGPTLSIYDREDEYAESTEVGYQKNSPLHKAITYVCRRAGAYGW